MDNYSDLTSVLRAPVLTVTPSASQNDYNPAGLARCGLLRVNASASIKLTGLAAQDDGQILTILNASTDYLLWLEHENTASSAANRFSLPRKFPAFLMPGDAITLIYDGTDSRWRVLNWPNQGPAMGLQAFSDFTGEATTVGASVTTTMGPFGAITSGTAATIQASSYLVNTTEKPAGIIQLDTGTTSTGKALIGNTGSGQIVPGQGAALSVVRLAVEATVDGSQTFQVWTGFLDDTMNDGVGWENRWTGSAAEWSQTRAAGGSLTRSNTGSPSPDNNYLWLVVFINPGWTRADFIYSKTTDLGAFTKVNSPTTGFPSSSQLAGWTAAAILKSAGNTQRNVSLDLAGYRVDQARG